MIRFDIMVGNIGTGKSTLARKIMNLHGSVIVNMDSLQSSLSCNDYGRYDNEKKIVYQAVEEAAIKESLRNGISVCVDRTNMDIERRKRFIQIAKQYTDEIRCYDLGSGSSKSLSRRNTNTRGVELQAWNSVHDFMKKAYQQPTLDEGFVEIINPSERFKIHAFDFDGTIVENQFPLIGDIVDDAVCKMNELYQDLSNIVIIWTCRDGEYVSEMRGFLIKNKIPFDFINENPIFPVGRKIFAHEYYDDRNSTSRYGY